MSDPPNKRAKMDTSKTGVKVSTSDREDAKVPVKQPVIEECNREFEKNRKRTWVTISKDVVPDCQIVQDQRIVNVDSPFTNAIQALFTTRPATAGMMSYGILREGLLRSGEILLKDYTSPLLTFKKGLLFNKGQKDTYSFESPNGETITSYAVIAQEVKTDMVTADVLDGGIGKKHIKLEVKSHEEGPWKYRVVVCGKKNSSL